MKGTEDNACYLRVNRANPAEAGTKAIRKRSGLL